MCNAANLRFLSYRVHADSFAVIGSSSKHNICTLLVPNDVLHHAIYTLQSVQHKLFHAIINHHSVSKTVCLLYSRQRAFSFNLHILLSTSQK